MVSKKDKIRHLGILAKNTAKEKFSKTPEQVTIKFGSEDNIEAEFKTGMGKDIETYSLSLRESMLPSKLKSEKVLKPITKKRSTYAALGIGLSTSVGAMVALIYFTWHVSMYRIPLNKFIPLAIMALQFLSIMSIWDTKKGIRKAEVEQE